MATNRRQPGKGSFRKRMFNTKTDEQVKCFIDRAEKRHGAQTERYYTALCSYWLRCNLTQHQSELLEAAKKRRA